VVSREQVEVKQGKSVRVSVTWQGTAGTAESEPYLEVASDSGNWRVPVYQE
jgi:hypothetical protein